MRPAITVLAASLLAAGAASAQAPAVRIAAEYPLPRAPRPGERLILSTSGGERRLLLRADPATFLPPALPLLADLRSDARIVPFGAEGRCSAAKDGADILLSCRPGVRPAGLLLRFGGRRPRSAAAALIVRTGGSQSFSAQAVRPGEDASRAVPLTGERPLTLPEDEDAPLQLVIVAPAGGGALRISGLHLAATAPPRHDPAGAWAWQPHLWQQRGGAALIEDALRHDVKRLYVTLVVADGRVQHQRELIAFLRAANRAGIEVEAVEGAPQMVLAAGLADAVARAAAIRRFREAAPPEARLAGVQYDIEPYVLPGWGSAPLDHAAWSAAVNRLAEALGGPIHLVLPFWVANEPAGLRFLDAVEPAVGEVSVMSYRTDPALVTAIAEPLLHWGSRAGKPVRLALEAGPVASETEESFVSRPRGRLALIERNGAAVALLLRDEGAIPGAVMYASEGAVEVPAARISFLGDEAAMKAAARSLVPPASAWSAFAGIDYHGLAWRGL